MKTTVALILMVSAFMALIAPECPISLRIRPQYSNLTSSDTSIIDTKIARDESLSTDTSPNDSNPSDMAPHICSHCHFGHCGLVVDQLNVKLIEFESPYGVFSKSLTLKSFESSPFRPPIA